MSMGTIAKSELTQIINSVMQQVRAEMDRAFSVLDPHSRLLACLDDRDNRLQQELKDRESTLYEKLLKDIGAMLENKSNDTKSNDETPSPKANIENSAGTGEGISTEVKEVAKSAMEELDGAQKALNFEQYTTQSTKPPLTPETELLRKQLMGTPVAEDWEDKVDGNKLSNELHKINEEIATLEKSDDKSATQGAASPGVTNDDPTEETMDTQGDATKESQTPITTKPPYSLGLGDDDISTTSDVALGLDSKSLGIGVDQTKAKEVRVSARIAAQTSSEDENEKDAT